MRGRRIRGGSARGETIVCRNPLSFLGGIDPSTGEILDKDSGSQGQSVRDTVLCFPYGRGSTVGSYAMYQLKLNGMAPAAIVNQSAEPIVATGAIMSEIPMVDGIDTSLMVSGDDVHVNASKGIVELKGVKEHHVVTSILRNGGKVLLLRRSGNVRSYRGQWAGVSGYIEEGETDIDAARREVMEEVKTKVADPVRRIRPESFRSGETVWTVHAFLFDVPSRQVSTDWEHDEHKWIGPEELTLLDYVPGLDVVVRKLLGRINQ